MRRRCAPRSSSRANRLGRRESWSNNALYQYPDLIVRVPVRSGSACFGVIATGTFIGTREFGRHFVEHGLEGGAIVNISTLNSTAPASMLAAYCSAKAAVSQFTNVAALEYASMGIRVNAIAPGLVNTELSAAFLGESPDVRAAFVRNTPLARVGEPEDQARVAVFLASTASAWMTGVTLLVDGGMHLLGVPDNWELFKGPLGKTEPTSGGLADRRASRLGRIDVVRHRHQEAGWRLGDLEQEPEIVGGIEVHAAHPIPIR